MHFHIQDENLSWQFLGTMSTLLEYLLIARKCQNSSQKQVNNSITKYHGAANKQIYEGHFNCKEYKLAHAALTSWDSEILRKMNYHTNIYWGYTAYLLCSRYFTCVNSNPQNNSIVEMYYYCLFLQRRKWKESTTSRQWLPSPHPNHFTKLFPDPLYILVDETWAIHIPIYIFATWKAL